MNHDWTVTDLPEVPGGGAPWMAEPAGSRAWSLASAARGRSGGHWRGRSGRPDGAGHGCCWSMSSVRRSLPRWRITTRGASARPGIRAPTARSAATGYDGSRAAERGRLGDDRQRTSRRRTQPTGSDHRSERSARPPCWPCRCCPSWRSAAGGPKRRSAAACSGLRAVSVPPAARARARARPDGAGRADRDDPARVRPGSRGHHPPGCPARRAPRAAPRPGTSAGLGNLAGIPPG
jgi:hypothetical protein